MSYGGLYFRDETLYINVTKGNSSRFKKEFDLEVEYEVVEVNYSVKELEKIKKLFVKEIVEFSIRGLSIDYINNHVVIHTELNYEDFIKILNKNFDRSTIDVQKWDGELEKHIMYTTNGERVKIKDNWYSTGFECTIGFAAKDSSGSPGIVTAGHCLDEIDDGDKAYYEGNHAGYTRDYRYRQGDVDAGFIELKDPLIGHTWLPTRNLVSGDNYDYLAPDNENYYVVGYNVEFHGSFDANGGYDYDVDYGQITTQSYDITNPNTGVVEHRNMVATNIVTHYGDSGGPLILDLYIGEGYYEYVVIGILSGKLQSTGYTYFSKTSDILDELNLTAY